MSELSKLNPTERFTGRAETYAQFRPDYPPAALDFIVAHCGLGAGSVVVDIGAGTGISSRLLAERGLRVIGIEPNEDMRKQAEAASAMGSGGRTEYRAGRGEATGLPDACADLVVSCQAFHWLDPQAALPEFHRVLKMGGWAALLWNERNESDPFTAAYGQVIRSFPDATRLEGARQRAGQAFLEHPLFAEKSLTHFGHAQTMNEEQLLGRALSVSYAPKEPLQKTRGLEALKRVFRQFERDGEVRLRYQTSVYAGRRQD